MSDGERRPGHHFINHARFSFPPVWTCVVYTLPTSDCSWPCSSVVGPVQLSSDSHDECRLAMIGEMMPLATRDACCSDLA